ncbi:MAG: hypothetical protein ACOYYS_13310 [Chloroflexota bacterium]
MFLLIIFLASGAYGAYQSEVGLRRRKSRHNYADSLFEWADHLSGGFRNEGLIWLATLTHFIALTVIALTTLAVTLRQTTAPGLFFSSDFTGGDLRAGVASISACLVAYLWGTALSANPLYKPFHQPAHLALSAEGILYAGRLFPWNVFTHFTVSAPGGVVRLWSASAPRLVLFPLRPITAADHRALTEILARYLPTAVPSPQQYSWPVWFLPTMVFGTATAAVTASWLLLLHGGSVGILVTTILVFLFANFGGQMIIHVGFGGMGRAAKLQDDTAA